MPAYPNITMNLVSQVQPKSGCLRGLKTNEPKNCPTVNLCAGAWSSRRSRSTAANSSEKIRPRAAGTMNRAASAEIRLTMTLPSRMASGVAMPTRPDTLPRRSTGTWSGMVALAAASTALNAACAMHQPTSTRATDCAVPTTARAAAPTIAPPRIHGRRMPSRLVVRSDRRPASGLQMRANSAPTPMTVPSAAGAASAPTRWSILNAIDTMTGVSSAM